MRRFIVVIVTLLAAAAAAPVAQGASSCPPEVPVADVATGADTPEGLAANGLTVSRGTMPERFDANVIGVLDDGIAPGVDMILAETDSPAIDRVGGIWAGMSGSPVYTDSDGRLIGAVAYGLSDGPSKIAGLTSAEDMYRLLDLPATQRENVHLPRALQRELVATGEVTRRQAAGGLEQLPLPMSVSGLSPSRARDFNDRVLHGNGPIAVSGASSAAEPGPMEPGANFAAALSYGDVTAAGVGTATAVCGSRVLAFGHPMNFDGPTALSAHSATAITIQDDAHVPYKLANIGGIVGTLDQDRRTGIRALLGSGPTPIPVTSRVSAGATTRNGVTNINRTSDTPGIGASHLLSNLDRVLDRIGAARARVGWTVTGTANGEPFSLTRNNRFADRDDLSIQPSDDLFVKLSALVENPFADVTIRDVTIDASAASFAAFRITGIQQRAGGAWVDVDLDEGVQAAPGSRLRVRVLLAADRNPDAVVPPLELRLNVPGDAAGQSGSLDVTGGPGDEEPGGDAASFDDLLASLRDAPRNDDVVADLSLDSGASVSVRGRVSQVVTGGLSIPVTVAGGEGER